MILKEVSKPTEGDYRVETKFAWFPIWVDNKRVWFQKYQLFYEYKYHFYYDMILCRRIWCKGWVLIDQKVVTKEPERHYH